MRSYALCVTLLVWLCLGKPLCRFIAAVARVIESIALRRMHDAWTPSQSYVRLVCGSRSARGFKRRCHRHPRLGSTCADGLVANIKITPASPLPRT
nr:unnamed protein product [Digitaria exilis]